MASNDQAKHQISLLIVDDEASLRFLIAAAAERSGLFRPIATAVDGRAAYDWLVKCEAAEAPDLVVTDLSMPHMSGLELVRAMKNDLAMRDIPVAMMTSSDVPNDREDALAAGVCAFVTKPSRFDELVRALASIGRYAQV
ncbi:MAG: hypothetical protein RIQ93_605 [Verrucomicrobiota bacterium]|jgi:CheY-like chemotaxis protein